MRNHPVQSPHCTEEDIVIYYIHLQFHTWGVLDLWMTCSYALNPCTLKGTILSFLFSLVLSTWGLIDLRGVVLYVNEKYLPLILMQKGSAQVPGFLLSPYYKGQPLFLLFSSEVLKPCKPLTKFIVIRTFILTFFLATVFMLIKYV